MKTKPQRLPPIPASACTSAHDTLEPLLPILEAFNHRHKNQHRASHWWAEFGILRRSVRALASDALHRQAVNLLNRARWIKNHITPRCYVAFTQLAADNQHAALGLMLLAALAQINTVLSDLLPEDEQSQKVGSIEASLPSKIAPSTSKEESLDMGLDRGTVVSRDDVSTLRRNATSTSKSEPTVETNMPTKFVSTPQKVEKRKLKKKPSGNKGDAFANLFGNLG